MMTILHGDCLELMADMDANSVDAIVTDPPYELGFMGKKWDGTGIAFDPATWESCLRVLKPGGHLLAFSGTRTSHRMICAIEDAGFEIRDSLAWMFGSGFPKSLDVGKAIDATLLRGGSNTRRLKQTNEQDREEIGERFEPDRNNGFKRDYEEIKRVPITAPATPEAEQWDGWGTALKPGHEPICLARKPLIGTVAANVITHGTGALNIDGCRIETEEALGRLNHSTSTFNHKNTTPWVDNSGGKGRWPANVVLDEISAAHLDAMSGTSISRKGKPRGSQVPGDGWGMTRTGAEYDDAGGPSRFFYTAKASSAERSAGLDSPSTHPTVKPLSLMRWLVRLVTPPGGTVMDPFAGSGTTGCAAVLEGFGFIGIEQDAEYVEIARKRIVHWTPKPEPQLALNLGATTQ